MQSVINAIAHVDPERKTIADRSVIASVDTIQEQINLGGLYAVTGLVDNTDDNPLISLLRNPSVSRKSFL
jgi:hypothetical protein